MPHHTQGWSFDTATLVSGIVDLAGPGREGRRRACYVRERGSRGISGGPESSNSRRYKASGGAGYAFGARCCLCVDCSLA